MQGTITLNQKGHYGISNGEDGTAIYACFYAAISSYCPTTTHRKVFNSGIGSTFEERTSTSAQTIAIGSTVTIGSAINDIDLTGLISYEPTGTTVEVEVVNGGHLKAAHSDQLFRLRTLVTKSSGVPISMEQTTLLVQLLIGFNLPTLPTSNVYSRLQVSWFHDRQCSSSRKVWWNSSEPGNSRLSCIPNGEPIQCPNSRSNYLFLSTYIYFYIYFYSGTSNAYTPTLEDLNVQLFAQAPSNVKIDIGGDEVTSGHIRTLTRNYYRDRWNLLSAINSEIRLTEVDL